jgi:hypothetical protein
MARKRKGTPVDPAFQMFQSGAPEWHEDETDQNKDKTTQNKSEGAGGYDVAMKALQDQIAMLREAQNRNSRTSSALMSQTGVDQPPQVITEMNLENLPDPVTDPQGYAREIAKRGQEMIASQRNYDAWAATKQKQSATAYDTVWNKFTQDHPEYAAHEKLVKAAATSVIAEARSRNLDPNKLVLGDTENFFEDVMKEMRDMAGGDTIFKAEDDTDETDDNNAGASGASLETEDEDDPDRTAGVFGGQDSGGRPNPSAKPVETDMFKDIREFQQKNGWHL